LCEKGEEEKSVYILQNVRVFCGHPSELWFMVDLARQYLALFMVGLTRQYLALFMVDLTRQYLAL